MAPSPLQFVAIRDDVYRIPFQFAQSMAVGIACAEKIAE